MPEKETQGKKGFLQAVKEFIYGMAAHESTLVAMKSKAGLEHLLMLSLYGDMLGVPMPRSYYSLRLLPYLAPGITGWKRFMLREKDFTDQDFFD
ncbi:MAG: hypothetical protein HQK57_12780 [Deltaproteobacteria bacterium]|nr:hypothetical protein [Deltaproteobacteria bacterium]